MTKPMVIIEPAGMKNQDGSEIWHIRLGFETVSWQLVAHIQKRFYSIHAEPFSRTPKSSKQKKGSASRVACDWLTPRLHHTSCRINQTKEAFHLTELTGQTGHLEGITLQHLQISTLPV